MTSKSLGVKLKDCRLQLQLSPKQVASELGISPRAYLDMENGNVDFKLSKLVLLINILKIDIAEVFNTPQNSFSNYDKKGVEMGGYYTSLKNPSIKFVSYMKGLLFWRKKTNSISD